MIKTLSDYNLLESEEWKDSINTLFLELRSKLLDLVLGTLAKKLDPHKRFGIPKPEQKNGAFSNAAA